MLPIRPSSRRRPALLALAIATLLIAPAASPAPAKKDSNARMKPKQVTLSAAVVPAEARPGDTVALRVTAKLQPGWHIYTYARTQQGEGPRNTRFELFDPAGLAPAGDWTPATEPLRKKEPAFPELDSVAFHEGEVTWTLPLKVPADAPPGPVALKVQASYQICDAKSCSFPGQWTLPDAPLTILASKDRAPADAPKQAAASPDSGPRPSKPDSPARLRPQGVDLTAAFKPAEAKPGATVQYQVTAKLQPGWHIYDYAKDQPSDGPRVTQFEVFDSAGLAPAGDWTASTAPILKQEPAFNNLLVSSFENEVTWSLPFKVPADAPPGSRSVKVQASYQICDPMSCSPPGRWTLPLATLTILPADAHAALARSDVPPPAASSEPAAASAEKPAPAAPATVAEKPAKARVVSDVEKTARQGIVPLMVASALGGLLALVMPCVWPMIPITVNFFVKQGQKNQGSTTGLAITYCLAIIGVFTAVGVFCSFFVSATALPRLANNPWLNFGVAALFLAFGLSLLGLFEIRLPNALLNASSQGESRGGLVGVIFMALTLTITSFTCTFPVVGGLLVMAASGEFFYPIIGLTTFATVLAFPFFLLALAPGLLSKVPKSGDWMNSVKVIGGLIEIGAAFKFLNTAELSYVTPENAWIDAQLILTIWVVLAAVCGVYLLGLFRTDHDYEEVKVGPGRIVLGVAFLSLALLIAPALFGRPPANKVWSRMVVGLLPPDVAELSRGSAMLAGAGGGSSPQESEVHATATDPKEAEAQEKRFHGVWWGFSYDAALARARSEGKPVLIDFTGVNCANCRLMESNVLPRPEVVAVLDRFVTVQLYTAPTVPIPSLTADQREELANANSLRQIDLTNDNTNPFYVVVAPDGSLLGTTGGYREPEVFVKFLTTALEKHRAETPGKVASAP